MRQRVDPVRGQFWGGAQPFQNSLQVEFILNLQHSRGFHRHLVTNVLPHRSLSHYLRDIAVVEFNQETRVEIHSERRPRIGHSYINFSTSLYFFRPHIDCQLCASCESRDAVPPIELFRHQDVA